MRILRCVSVQFLLLTATSRGLGHHSASTSSLQISHDGDADSISNHTGLSQVRIPRPDSTADMAHPTGLSTALSSLGVSCCACCLLKGNLYMHHKV